MKLSPRYGSHLPVLLQALAKTDGPVLELGMGAYSTPLLSAVCNLERRQLWSFDNDRAVAEWATKYASEWHTIRHVNNWEAAFMVDRLPWDVVLVDHSPSERRVVEIARLARLAKYIIIHDSNGRYKEYNYPSIYTLFQHKRDYTALEPSTTILSNLVSLHDFWDHSWQTRSITF